MIFPYSPNKLSYFVSGLLFILLLNSSAIAQVAVIEKQSAAALERYTPGTIQSVESADQLLLEVEQERARIEAEFIQEDQACRAKFFMTSCMDAAKERRRKSLAQLNPVEAEANGYKRMARAAQRDKSLAEKNAREEPEAATRIPKQKPEDQAAPAGSSDATHKSDQIKESRGSGSGQSSSQRAAQHQAKMERLRAKEKAEEDRRTRKAEEREEKLQKSLARQREIAEKKAQKEEAAKGKVSTPAPP